MRQRVLITGSEGLIGRAVAKTLLARGFEVTKLDLAAGDDVRGDVKARETVTERMRGCDGVIHLAAVSRVVWGERDTKLCWDTNVGGTANVVRAALSAPTKPWVILGSSREVYGQAPRLPVVEDVPIAPVNHYGRSKAEAERVVSAARADGLVAAILRFSNVYGDTRDHADRVVPAFTRAAARGGSLKVEGHEHVFDFNHVNDVARGVAQVAALLSAERKSPPPIHLTTGRPTTLGALATLAVHRARAGTITRGAPRAYDVARFVGDPSRARAILGWRAEVPLEEGVAAMVDAFAEEARR